MKIMDEAALARRRRELWLLPEDWERRLNLVRWLQEQRAIGLADEERRRWAKKHGNKRPEDQDDFGTYLPPEETIKFCCELFRKNRPRDDYYDGVTIPEIVTDMLHDKRNASSEEAYYDSNQLFDNWHDWYEVP